MQNKRTKSALLVDIDKNVPPNDTREDLNSDQNFMSMHGVRFSLNLAERTENQNLHQEPDSYHDINVIQCAAGINAYFGAPSMLKIQSQ